MARPFFLTSKIAWASYGFVALAEAGASFRGSTKKGFQKGSEVDRPGEWQGCTRRYQLQSNHVTRVTPLRPPSKGLATDAPFAAYHPLVAHHWCVQARDPAGAFAGRRARQQALPISHVREQRSSALMVLIVSPLVHAHHRFPACHLSASATKLKSCDAMH